MDRETILMFINAAVAAKVGVAITTTNSEKLRQGLYRAMAEAGVKLHTAVLPSGEVWLYK